MQYPISFLSTAVSTVVSTAVTTAVNSMCYYYKGPRDSFARKMPAAATQQGKASILDEYSVGLFSGELDQDSIMELLIHVNQLLKNPVGLRESEDLKSLIGNRGYSFQQSALPASFCLFLMGIIVRICGSQVLNTDVRLEHVNMKVASRIFFRLSKVQRDALEYYIDRLNIVYSDGFDDLQSTTWTLCLNDYVLDVNPSHLDPDSLERLFRRAFSYEELRRGIPNAFRTHHHVKEFIRNLTGGLTSNLDYFFDLDRKAKGQLKEHKTVPVIEMLKQLNATVESGQEIYRNHIAFQLEANQILKMCTSVSFAGRSNSSRVNDLGMSIDEIQSELEKHGQSLLDPVSNFKLIFHFQSESFEIFTGGSVFKGKLSKSKQNSPEQIEALLKGRALEQIKTLFPDAGISDAEALDSDRAIIDLRLLTYYLPSEMTIFDSHLKTMKSVADEYQIQYFAANCDAHSKLNRCHGLNSIYHSHESLLDEMRAFVMKKMALMRAQPEFDGKWNIVFEKWIRLCSLEKMHHERNTIPFVTLTALVIEQINKQLHQGQPMVKLLTGCKSAKDRTFAVLPGVEILSYLFKIRMKGSISEGEFASAFESLFTEKGYFNPGSLNKEEERLLLDLFNPRMFFLSNERSEGVPTNINTNVFQSSFFKNYEPLKKATIQILSLLDIKS